MLIIRGMIGSLFRIVLLTALLLIPAGTWNWPRAIQFLVVYGVLLQICIIVLALVTPGSLEARLKRPFAKSQPIADKIITFFIIFVVIAWVVFIPIDVFHLQLLPPPQLIVSIFGALVFFLGLGIVIIAIYQNLFATPIVEDQTERGQVLVDIGLYGRIRHPFYLGTFLCLIGIGLWLESYASVLVLPIMFGVIIARIFIEEKTLKEKLPGYVEYMAKVRYRLIPFVW